MEARLGNGDDPIADVAVAGDADLAGEDDVVTDMGGTGEADLGAQQGVFTDGGAVAYLDEVIDLGAGANAGGADAGAIDTGVGLDLDPVAQNSGAGLGNLVPAPLFIFSEAEAVGADDGAILQHHIVANPAVFAHNGVRVREEAIADVHTGVNDNVGEEDRVGTNDGFFADDNIGADMRASTNFRAGMHDGRGMNAGGPDRRLIENLDRLRESEIGIPETQGRGGDIGEVRADKNSRSMRGAGEGGVLWVGNEGDLTRAGFFDAGDTGDFEIGIAA